MTDNTPEWLDKILMFGFTNKDFVNDLVGKYRLEEAKAQILTHVQELIAAAEREARISTKQNMLNYNMVVHDAIPAVEQSIKELQQEGQK